MNEQRGVDRFAIFTAAAYAFLCGAWLAIAMHGRKLPKALELKPDPRQERAAKAAERAFHETMADRDAAAPGD